MANEDANQTKFTENIFRQLSVNAHITVLEYDGSGMVLYQGIAVPGTATSDALWQIMKFTNGASGPTAILFADGDTNFDNVWDNRAALSYS